MPWVECEHTLDKSRTRFIVRKPITSIGRATGNDLVLNDPAIEKSHASLLRQGGKLTLTQASRSGDLYVNGKRAKSASLNEGDTVQIGLYQLTIHLGDPAPEPEPASPEGLSLDILQRLVDLSAELMRDTEPQRIFDRLLSGLVELTNAEKGFLIVLQDGRRHLASSHNVDGETLDLSRVSDTIVDRVVEHLQPVIVSDALNDGRFGRAKSVVDLKLSSVMCVPMIYRSDLLGLIYLGNDKITDLFTERDLALLKVYAAQGALVIHHALLVNKLQVETRALRRQLRQASQGEMIGSSPPMKRVFKILKRASPTDLSVLVLGETGTGKELVAREVHRLSERKGQPFIAINCGAIPENLLESELFGHKKGSFTGANTDKVGKVEAANKGTLFLDEIGEMPTQLQVKLLRVLQERVIERVGDLTPRPVDIRLVAATNKNLPELIRDGTFREDLYYRLNELVVELPALRDRGEDIAVLGHYFLNKYREQYGGAAKGFTNQALLAMNHYAWPGNVRELENRVKKAVIMSDRALLNADDLGLIGTDKRHVRGLDDAAEQFKLDYIRQVLELNNWNKAQTARDLDVDPRTIFRYIEKMTDIPEG
ncbi:MAG: GAF domain-containing protein [Deltaproteobacteria bacterium]|nr:MAG: GAF domain-containing protein [Deltaproteobacteria bacterium]